MHLRETLNGTSVNGDSPTLDSVVIFTCVTCPGLGRIPERRVHHVSLLRARDLLLALLHPQACDPQSAGLQCQNRVQNE